MPPTGTDPNKAKTKLAKLHARITNIRSEALHQLKTNLKRRFHTIGIENINVWGMVKNHHLARSISDMGFFEFRRKLEYKAEQRGGLVVVADRFFASSKICSVCKYKMEVLSLSVRKWSCPSYGNIHDRNVNAAKNLKNMAVSVSLWRDLLIINQICIVITEWRKIKEILKHGFT